MMLVGKIEKDSSLWRAECRPLGVFTQGKSASNAMEQLADAIEVKIGRDGFKARVTTLSGAKDSYTVLIESDQPELLFSELLKVQRQLAHLTVTDVAKKLGSSSHNAYSAYESGKREPSLSKMRELLAAVAPDMAMTIGPRVAGEAKPKRKATR